VGRFQNFRIWRGRLPHWRADGETYFATFRHRRPLEPGERALLMKRLMSANSKRWELLAVAIAPESTQLIFRMLAGAEGHDLELADVLEKAKRTAGNDIIRRTSERFPPFYAESYDRIIRDQAEFEDRIAELLELTDDEDDVFVAPEASLQQGQA